MKSNRFNCFPLLIVSTGLLIAAFSSRGQSLKVIVSAGNYDRKESIAVLETSGLQQPIKALRDPYGTILPVQGYGDGKVAFVVPHLPKRQSATFIVSDRPVSNPSATEAVREGTKLKLIKGSQTVLEYQAEAGPLPRPQIKPIFKRGGYLHPVFSPSGRAVTDDFPANHIHHHGIWWAWTKTDFQGRQPDFWNMGDGKGKVEFVRTAADWSGPVFAGFQAAHRFIDLTASEPKAALEEVWEVRAWNVGDGNGVPYHLFDLTSVQRCSGPDPLRLPEYHYGGIGLRGNWAWNGAKNTEFLTSEGETDRIKGNETRGRWCYMGGKLDGKQTGLAILCHPENFRAPQPMRLHPSEPFFCYAPSQLGDWAIEPGKPYISRYRFVVFDGTPNKAEIDRLWNDYANPVEVKMENR